MSQSRAAKLRRGLDEAGLHALDIMFAVCVHVLILALFLILNLWHKTPEFHPQTVQVSLISAQQLKKLQHPKRKPVKVHKKKIVKPVAKPKPKPKPKKVLKKPALKLPDKAKPVIKPKPKTRVKQDPDFDPFKPMESTSDVKQSAAPKRNSKAADVFVGQLSKQEINRYIALIQNAVQRHWKVPNVSLDVKDPLVEMLL
ncbi:MAG: TonB C-terminal domain-containing protein, partial [Mariprofundaceae bacterium]|nr:TonB C-terminal domain-containing protein [Mariprofundaceae bacterium]